MATPAEIVTAIETAMAAQAVAPGVVSVQIDNVTTEYSWDEAVKQLIFWEDRAAKAAGTRKTICNLDLRNL